MAHKTIMIQEDVYNVLNSLKSTGQSFNDVIRELILKSRDLTPFFGIIDEVKGDQILSAIMELKSEEKDRKKDCKMTIL